jgi:CBS domain-containing membrane protein
MADAGVRHVPVMDADRNLAGIISQADLEAALCRGRTTPGGM